MTKEIKPGQPCYGCMHKNICKYTVAIDDIDKKHIELDKDLKKYIQTTYEGIPNDMFSLSLHCKEY